MKRTWLIITRLLLSVAVSMVAAPLHAQERPAEVLSNESVVQMLLGKLPKSLVLTKIETTKNAFDVTPSGLIGLVTSKVPSDVIKLMMKSAAANGSTELLTNDGVIQMTARLVPRDIVIAKIQSTKTDFDLTASGLVSLNQNKVSQDVMKAMMAPPPAPPAPSSASVAPVVVTASSPPASAPPPAQAVSAPPTRTQPVASGSPVTVPTPKVCKPDVSSIDRLSKAKIEEWGQDIYSTGFLNQVVMEVAEVNMRAAIVRNGEQTSIRIILTKDEEKVARAMLEDRYRAEKGNEFLFGFKGGGEPLRFVADQATSVTAAQGALSSALRTTVTLIATTTNAQLRTLQQAWGSRQFDAVRVALSSMTVEKGINDGNGKKLAEKFGCFFVFAEQTGLLK